MEKKTLLTAIIISALLFSAVAGTQFIRLGAANPFPFSLTFTGHPIITIHLPLYNETYSSNNVPLDFTITKDGPWVTNWTVSGRTFKNQLSHVSIVIDGKLYRKFSAHDDLSSPFSYYNNLTNLEDGAHNLKIIAHCDGWDLETHNLWQTYLPYNVSSDLIAFTVDATSPFVSVLSPENDSYESTENLLDVTLNFTVNEPVSQLTYSLDGQKNVTIAGNTTLANLPYGEHNVTVYATDNAGNIGASETVTFTLAELEPAPFPTTLFVAAGSGASVAIIGVGLLVCFKKKRKVAIES